MQKHWVLTGVFCAALAAHPAMAQYTSSPTPAPAATYLETRVTDLETQLRSLNGRLEEQEYENKQLRTALDRLQADADQRLSQLEHAAQAQTAAAAPNTNPPAVVSNPEPSSRTGTLSPLATPAPTPTPVHAATTSGPFGTNDAVPPSTPAPPDRQLTGDNLPGGTKPVTGRLGTLYMSNGQVKNADQNAVVPVLPPKPDDYGLTPQEQYDHAFELLRASNFEGAENGFKGFITKNPQDKLIDNAKYWLGETYYARGHFDAAAVAFADAYQTAPQGTKAADSLFKLGMSLEGLNKHDDACTTFSEIKNKFPHVSANLRARTDVEVKKLKCGP